MKVADSAVHRIDEVIVHALADLDLRRRVRRGASSSAALSRRLQLFALDLQPAERELYDAIVRRGGKG